MPPLPTQRDVPQPLPRKLWQLVVQWPPSREYWWDWYSTIYIVGSWSSILTINSIQKHGANSSSSFELWLHEWRKHGKHSGLGFKEFFKKIVFLYGKLSLLDYGRNLLTINHFAVIGRGQAWYSQYFGAFRQIVYNLIGANIGVHGYTYERVVHVLELTYKMDHDSGIFVDASNPFSSHITAKNLTYQVPIAYEAIANGRDG